MIEKKISAGELSYHDAVWQPMMILSRFFKIIFKMSKQMEHQNIYEQIEWWQTESARLIQLAVQTHDAASLEEAWRYSRAIHGLTRFPGEHPNPELAVWADIARECIRMALEMDVDKVDALEVALAYFRAVQRLRDNPAASVLDKKIAERTQQLRAQKYELALYEALELCYILETGELVPQGMEGATSQELAEATLFQIHNCIFWYLGRWARLSEVEYIQCMVEERIAAENEPGIILLDEKRTKTEQAHDQAVTRTDAKIISLSQERMKRQIWVS